MGQFNGKHSMGPSNSSPVTTAYCIPSPQLNTSTCSNPSIDRVFGSLCAGVGSQWQPDSSGGLLVDDMVARPLSVAPILPTRSLKSGQSVAEVRVLQRDDELTRVAAQVSLEVPRVQVVSEDLLSRSSKVAFVASDEIWVINGLKSVVADSELLAWDCIVTVVVSKALLSEYIAAKKRNRPFRGLGLEHMNKSCPVIPSQLTSSTLRSIQFQTDIFCLRERDLLSRFAAEVSEHQAQGQSKEYAFILSHQLAEDLGRAFSERAIFQTFIEAEAAVSTGSLKNILGHLRSMYALISLEEDASFLRYGYLSPDNAAAVRKELTRLCTELRPHALALVSSFGIPDAFLSPIAYNWIDANSWSSVQQ
ncbi:hypothetical protein TEA_008587 [Camellia sinensis var. sinensis]|uniref:acyl-CoA oxidase n=1 Tax=Camellia sinensis var. sinensis TaxID=542762 RepID=A0A4S4EL24_CAMSN|nr:hypothetical protein TEA_008587 [Camellia sinensis var. sinensis]